MKHELEYKDLLITVHGDYYKGSSATTYHPGDTEEFEINKITVGIEEIDITIDDESLPASEQERMQDLNESMVGQK